MLQSDDVRVSDIRVRKFQINIQKSDMFAVHEIFMDCDETEEESKEDDDDIDYDQVLSLANSKLLFVKIIQVICSIF